MCLLYVAPPPSVPPFAIILMEGGHIHIRTQPGEGRSNENTNGGRIIGEAENGGVYFGEEKNG